MYIIQISLINFRSFKLSFRIRYVITNIEDENSNFGSYHYNVGHIRRNMRPNEYAVGISQFCAYGIIGI